jgi:dihydrofolate reductase
MTGSADQHARARVNIVVAMADNGVIGRDGGLPWHLPGDLRRFR